MKRRAGFPERKTGEKGGSGALCTEAAAGQQACGSGWYTVNAAEADRISEVGPG